MQRRIGHGLRPANARLRQTLGNDGDAAQILETQYSCIARRRAHHDRTTSELQQPLANLIERSTGVDREEFSAHQGR